MLIARFRPHPCAEIMQGLFNDDDEWCYWLERLEALEERMRLITIEEEYARKYAQDERKAKRARLTALLRSISNEEAHPDPKAMLRDECEAEAAYYDYYDD